jgi:hypothetical protein
VAANLLETFLLGAPTGVGRPQCHLVVDARPLRADLRRLREAVHRSEPGDFIAYAVPFEGSLPARLLTVATLGLRLRRAMRAIARHGAREVATYGVEPRLDAPMFAYELDSAASRYADRFLRPRGSGAAIRQLIARCFGYDPALGAVVVVGRKS